MKPDSRLILWSFVFSRLVATKHLARQRHDVLINLRNQLQRLVNSHRTVPTPRYTWSYSTTAELSEELRRCIENNEPRLQDVRVKQCTVLDFGADEHYDVTAQMIVGAEKVTTHFHAVIEGWGMVQVHAV